MRKIFAEASYKNPGATFDDLREAVATLEELNGPHGACSVAHIRSQRGLRVSWRLEPRNGRRELPPQAKTGGTARGCQYAIAQARKKTATHNYHPTGGGSIGRRRFRRRARGSGVRRSNTFSSRCEICTGARAAK